MSSYPIAHKINAGQNGHFAKDWYTRQQISVGHDFSDHKKQSKEDIHEKDHTQHNYVSRFLGCHPDGEKNLHIGDNIIAYAPNQDILLGVGSILSEPRYEQNPRTLTTEDTHHYWRDIAWLPWSKPVDREEIEAVAPRFSETGKHRAYGSSTLERYNGDFTGLKETIEKCERVDLNRL